MDRLLSFARSKQKEIIVFIGELVECESPSNDPAALKRFADLFASRTGDIAKVRALDGGHLRCEFKLPGRKKQGRILALGHSDTVWPLGTLKTMPFREKDGRLWGPGVLDMKSGLAFFVYAMRGLRELDIPVSRSVMLQINADEEIGSASSRRYTEEAARQSDFVLVVEPGTGLDGKLKTSRKGVGDYTVTVRGRAAHAGIDFSAGASAIVELARQIERIAGFTRLERGVTVNPGVVQGGTRTNVVAAEARAEIDVRIVKAGDAAWINRQFRRLKPFDKRCAIEVTGGLNRPPMERSRDMVALFREARRLARDLGVDLEESATGGGSDGNFTAALGVPTLDGLGGVGEGAHAENESILIDRIADRTALIAKIVSEARL
jgi:glutamate carboxypeptidase